MAGQHQRVVGQRQDDVAQAAGHRLAAAAGQVGAPDRAGEQHVAGQQVAPSPASAALVGDGRQGEHHRPLGVPGRVQRRATLRPARSRTVPVGEVDHVVRLAPGRPASELLLQHGHAARRPAGERVLQAVAVVAVDVGGDRRAPPQTGVTE